MRRTLADVTITKATSPTPPWRICVDTGGTFTDCLGVSPSGEVRRVKVLSSSAVRTRITAVLPGDRLAIDHHIAALAPGLVGMSVRRLGSPPQAAPSRIVGVEPAASAILLGTAADTAPGATIELFADEEAPILGARLLTGTAVGTPLPPISMRLGTTRATNALLERRGGPAGLFVSAGFADLLDIGTQQRPDLFALNIVKPEVLPESTVEVPGRLNADGSVLRPLDLAAVERGARRLLDRGITVAAVALMHSWINPEHENQVADLLQRLGFDHVSRSSSLSPGIRILPRAQTAAVNAYLTPVMDRYIRRVSEALSPGSSLHLMTSSGGLVRSSEFHAKDSLLSGPAGGVVGAAAAGAVAGQPRSIAFDMGGTSTDVSRFDGDFEYSFEHEVAGARILAPALAIESVAAGGGSICWVDEGLLRVGPRSAGADPGPACYGAGGALTVTDCNLLLGRLDPAGFQIPIDPAPARARLAELVSILDAHTSRSHDPDEVLEGLIEVAAERMASAIVQVSTKRGYAAGDHALICFGGAGGQHACGVASRLGIATIIVPADAGLLSAAGLAQARIERFAERQVLCALGPAGPILEPIVRELADDAARRVAAEGASPASIGIRRRIAQLRIRGQESSIAIDLDAAATDADAARLFHDRYRQLYGHPPPDRPIELESVRVVASTPPGEPIPRPAAPVGGPVPPRFRRARFAGRWTESLVIERASLRTGDRVAGPALILDPFSTTVVDPGWEAHLDASGSLVLAHVDRGLDAPPLAAAARDEITTGRLASIALEMGEMLRRVALSTNVKERLDFSCAVLDPGGRLVVNAPHIPVHLGALGVCVRAIREALPMAPGDVAVTNHPAFGGSHLPDVTVVTPVFDGPSLIAYVACRAHHAEIGGVRPGSMSTDARSLAEEGVVIPPMYLVRAGRARWESIEQVLSTGPYPTRSLQDNLADLRAQVASNQRGVASLQEFVRSHSAAELHHAMNALHARAAAGARRALERLIGKPLAALEYLDDGSPIRVRIDAARERTVIDFAGSAPVHAGSLNATAAIVRSAVMYVLRLLIDEPLPLNEGLLDPIDLRIPEGMLNPRFHHDPSHCPAVAGGNVETSQRTVDTLLKALGVSACSQGTMNNVIFGNAAFGYYETVCGGAGAGPGHAGASAVHTHMTNTRITDPELLELRYPVRLERFAIRRGSGGAGRFRGGDGVIRELAFLAPCSLTLLTQHRTAGPYGAAGGMPGAPGRQRIISATGAERVLDPASALDVTPGDRLVLETPGGGGWGVPASP